MSRNVLSVARCTLGLAAIGYGWAMSWVSQAGVVLVAAGLAVLLGPLSIRVARGEFRLVPRDPVTACRAFKRVAIVVAIGLTLLCGALVLQSSGGR